MTNTIVPQKARMRMLPEHTRESVTTQGSHRNHMRWLRENDPVAYQEAVRKQTQRQRPRDYEVWDQLAPGQYRKHRFGLAEEGVR